MKTVSRYVKNDSRFEKLESPYMNYRTTSNKAFDEIFKKFVVELATSDAEYAKKEEFGVPLEELNKIIEEVKNKLQNVISLIKSEEEKKSFVTVMQQIRDCGEFGSILYNSCNVISLQPALEKKEKDTFLNLTLVVQYLILKGEHLLIQANFSDYDILISDIADKIEKLESYVKNPEYPIDKIRKLQDKLMNLSKRLREKKASKESNITYLDCKINTKNEDLKFECEKICGLLLYLDENDNLSDAYNLFYRALCLIKSQEEFDEFIEFMNQIKEAGILGKRLFNSKEIDIENLTYDSSIQQNNSNLNQNEVFEAIISTVAATVCEEEFKNNTSLESLNDLITTLYEQSSILSGLIKKSNNEEILEYDKKLKKLISYYESKKQLLVNNNQK